MRTFVILLAAATGAALAAGFLGLREPLGTTLVAVRVPMAVVFGLVVIWADWPRRVRWPLAALTLLLLGREVWQG